MKICFNITYVFIVLKVFCHFNLAWWLVFSPMIVYSALVFITMTLFTVCLYIPSCKTMLDEFYDENT